MALRKPREFFTYGDHNFSVSLNAPIPGTQGSKDSAGTIFRAIVNELVKNGSGIIECIDYSLEMDGDAYTVHCTGTPVELSRVDGAYSGFAIHISVVPGFTVRNDEENGRLVDDTGYRD